MKIVLLSGTNSRLSGGLFYSVKNLGLSIMNHCGQEVSYICHDDKFSAEDRVTFQNLPLAIYHISTLPLMKRLGFSIDIHNVLEREKPDIIDIQGTWMYYSYAALRYKHKHPNTKIVITPRGTLDRLKKENLTLPKKIVSFLYEDKNFASADCFRTLCQPEYNSIREYGIKVPAAIIPNGFDLPEIIHIEKISEIKTILFVGRIHPKKGLLELLKGISLLKKKNVSILQKWRIRIAGWDQNGHIDLLKKFINKEQLQNFVKLIGPKYGKEKNQEFLNADAFVLTSFSEGMPMSVLEAWAYKLPVLMTKECNLLDGFEKEAAIMVETSPESICEGLQKLFSMSDSERNRIGNNGYKLVVEKYQWNKIAEDTVSLYNFLLGNGSKPDFLIY